MLDPRRKIGLAILIAVSFAFLLLVEPNDFGFAQSTGSATTVAGTGTAGFSGDGGPAESAQISVPRGIFVDSHKNLYIADTGNYRVRKVTADGIISTIAGTGVRNSSGDGGSATRAGMELPTDVALDSAGNLYIADSAWAKIRKVTPDGVIHTVAETDFIVGIAVDEAGNIYISETILWNYSYDCIRKVTPDGVISTVAGLGTEYPGDGGPATSAELRGVGKITFDHKGNLYFVESGRIRKVGSDGVISTVAGNGISGHSGDGDQAVLAQINPAGIAIDPYGNLYIAEIGNNCIRKVTTDGRISTILTGLNEPYDIESGPDGYLYIAEREGNRILKTKVYSATDTTMYFPEVIAGGGWSTLFTVTNTGPDDASGVLAFRDPEGNPLAVNAEFTNSTGATLPMPPASSFALTIPTGGTVFLSAPSSGGAGEMQTGWAQLEATGGVLSGMATYEFGSNANTYCMFSVPQARLLQSASIPVHNDDTLGKETAYAIANPGSTPVSIGLVLVDQAGIIVDDSVVLKVGPGQQIARYLWEDLACPRFRGSLILFAEGGQPFVLLPIVEKRGLFTVLPMAASQ